MISKITKALQTIRYNGIAFCLFRLKYSIEKKTGVISKKSPLGRWDKISIKDILAGNCDGDMQNILRKERPFFTKDISSEILRPYLKKTLEQADEIINGKLKYFFKDSYDLANDEDWTKNPVSGEGIDASGHWSKTKTFDPKVGDIKYVWEPSRFAWVYVLVRAYVSSKDEKYAEEFWQLFGSWLRRNQPNCGPDFACGQECAIRLFAMCFAYFTIKDAKSTTFQRLSGLYKAIGIHADRIESNIDFAISTRTNHSLTEAAGLYTAGILFPEFKHADRWLKLGKKVLTEEALKQICPDGSYIQHSMNYHRLMLQDFLWVLMLAKLNNDSFCDELVSRVTKSVEFLYQMQDENSGRVPNYGANDGALIVPLNNCDYLDYRPVIQSCWYLLKEEKLYENGPWDEDMCWLFGPEALTAPQRQKSRASQKFSDGGYYTLRDSDSWAMIRCHTYRDRVGHLDMLHLDLWANGINLLRDCGSYKYFSPAEPGLEMYFKSIYAHNTVIVDEDSPLQLVSRFLWLPRPCARDIPLAAEAGSDCIEWKGQHFAYNHKPWRVVHTRYVRVQQNKWEITDTLSGRGKHKLELRWHLPAEAGSISRTSDKVCLRLYNDWYLEISEADNMEIDLSQSTNCGGWESLYYGNKRAVKTLSVKKSSSLPATFKTVVQRERVK